MAMVNMQGDKGGASAMADAKSSYTIGAYEQSHAVGIDSQCNANGACQLGMVVRRLTPTECERLQGMPDGHTKIPWRGKSAEECPDGPRYKAIGNSIAVPCLRWIGERIISQ